MNVSAVFYDMIFPCSEFEAVVSGAVRSRGAEVRGVGGGRGRDRTPRHELRVLPHGWGVGRWGDTRRDGGHPQPARQHPRQGRTHARPQENSQVQVRREGIPVWCIPRAYKPYMLQWSPLVVAPGRSLCEVVWTGFQCWLPDVSSRVVGFRSRGSRS